MGDDTFNYSLALFNCVVLAVFTYFFPLNTDTRIWATIVIFVLTLMSNVLYFKKDELRGQRHRTFNETVALVDCYILEIVYPAFWVIKLLVGKPDLVKFDLANACDALVFFLVFVINMELSTLLTIAGEKGRRVGILPFVGILAAVACAVGFYIEVSAPGVQLPSYAQSICYLTPVLSLLVLRALESEGHI